MNRNPNTQRRIEDALKRVFQKGAHNEPDITRYQVLINNQPHFIGERSNELLNGQTISNYKAQLDDQGRPFSHIKDFALLSCGCKININTQRIYRCHFCKGIFCHVHSTQWPSKNISFCTKTKCQILGRLYQAGHSTLKVTAFSLSQIFGLELLPKSGLKNEVLIERPRTDEDNSEKQSDLPGKF